jgi:sulfite reductase (NADPH) flavoprotein alpha-component
VAELLTFAPIAAEELPSLTLPLLPRFYSIANSPKVFPHEIHLLVAHHTYHNHGQTRRGVASHFLCEIAQIGTTSLPIYLQPTPHFTLPEDPRADIILIGPGTGVAPFRAFLQERLATQAPGRNWLFFGERHRAYDFYYQEFWLALEEQGHLRLDLAFSRDTPQKIYVQHKMYESRKSLWNWLEHGAFFYICGDATRMVKEVETTLCHIVKEEGKKSEEEALAYLKQLKRAKRYLTDVY